MLFFDKRLLDAFLTCEIYSSFNVQKRLEMLNF